ncbi:MAG: hypothetical protein PHN31_04380 [Candidatus Gracilibacteria bacterium]|nr:hypothetical protein [Candidatus Gracilibacteria bacterium]
MPLLFLITYIVLSHYIYKKNVDNFKNILFIVKLNGIIGFALLFVYIVYYTGGNFADLDSNMYVYGFYFLLLSYIVIFLCNLLKFRKMFLNNVKDKVYDNKGSIERVIDSGYFVIILVLAFIYFGYSSSVIDFNYRERELFIYLIMGLSSFYVLVEKKLFSN